MKRQKVLSRRQFFKVSAIAVAGTIVTACQPAPSPTTVAQATRTAAPVQPTKPPQATTAPLSDATAAPTALPEAVYQEAPELAKLVQDGKLPPVEERLPANPLVVTPVEMVGVYGGTWKFFIDSVQRLGDAAEFNSIGLLMWNRDQNGSEACIAENWEVNDDGREFILHLRAGLKWSDGEPFTADDIIFWWEDIVGNKDLTPVIPYWMITANRKAGVIEKVDDATVAYRFSEPHGMFIAYLTKELLTFAPKHYLTQFHPKHVKQEELDEKVKAGGLTSWIDLFKAMQSPTTFGMTNQAEPTLFPWYNTTPSPAERFVYARNPFFFAVDTEGNQLPYINEADVRVVTVEVMNVNILAGEPNFQVSRQQSFKDMPVYMQNAEKNEYDVYQWSDLQISEAAIWPNQTTPDPVDRQIFQDRRFRIALSVAINRERINQTLYSGMGQPTAATLPPVESKMYKEEYARAYIQHDPEMANQLLDEMGLDKRDAQQFRLKPDGKRATFVIEVPSPRVGMIDNLNMIKDDYLEVGIELVIKAEAEALWTERNRASQFQMAGWPMAKSATETDLVPINDNTDWAVNWGLWYNAGGTKGEEPPAEIKKIQDAWSEILQTVDEKRQLELYDIILKAQAENVWAIGVVGPVPKPIIKKKWFHNVMEKSVWSFHHGHFIGATQPYQFFIEKDKQG